MQFGRSQTQESIFRVVAASVWPVVDPSDEAEPSVQGKRGIDVAHRQDRDGTFACQRYLPSTCLQRRLSERGNGSHQLPQQAIVSGVQGPSYYIIALLRLLPKAVLKACNEHWAGKGLRTAVDHKNAQAEPSRHSRS